MKGLLNFLVKYHVFFLFLIIQLVCLTLIVRYNSFHRVAFLNSSNTVTGKIYEKYDNAANFFSLRKINEDLAQENTKLRTELQAIKHADINLTITRDVDTDIFMAISAQVINNSVNKLYNYITLNKGSKHGIKPDMGIIGPDGAVGVIISVSKNYSTALSILNSRWSVNSKLSNSNHFGPLSWDGSNPYMAILEEIPYHVRVEKGEKVVTSGFSAVFPEGVPVGIVDNIEYREGETFQRIWVRLSTDFKSLSFVDVIENVTKNEQKELEKLMQDE
jgi:rod shape-determining protein MreC